MKKDQKMQELGGNQAQVTNDKLLTQAYTHALEEFKSLQARPGFDLVDFHRWNAARFKEQFNISYDDLDAIIRYSMPKATNSRFLWLEAVTAACGRGIITQKALLVGNALFLRFNEAHPYAWPSQETIARNVGWSSSNKRGVLEGLAQLETIGALKRVLARNCPPDIARQILAPKNEGGSGRDKRSVSYRRVDVSEWKNSNECTDHAPNKVHESRALNHKYKPKLLCRDFSHSDDANDLTLLQVGTSQIGYDTEQGKKHRYG